MSPVLNISTTRPRTIPASQALITIATRGPREALLEFEKEFERNSPYLFPFLRSPLLRGLLSPKQTTGWCGDNKKTSRRAKTNKPKQEEGIWVRRGVGGA